MVLIKFMSQMCIHQLHIHERKKKTILIEITHYALTTLDVIESCMDLNLHNFFWRYCLATIFRNKPMYCLNRIHVL